MDAIFLRSLEGLEDPPLVPTGDEGWEWLRGDKEVVEDETLSEGLLCQTAIGRVQEAEAWEESASD